jgi:hypothetical protein
MHTYTDPYIEAARDLVKKRNAGYISPETYKRMYAAVAAAAESEGQRCGVSGCEHAAYVNHPDGRSLCSDHAIEAGGLLR